MSLWGGREKGSEGSESRKRFCSLTGLWPEGFGIAFGNEYIVSVTGPASVSPLLHVEEQEPPSIGRNPAEDF
jgi:hypothetical protein